MPLHKYAMGVPLRCVQRLPDTQDVLQVADQGRGQHCRLTSMPIVVEGTHGSFEPMCLLFLN
eukprot:1149224-Pelagomonas_calceolata.AAC.7